ncbi:MAG: 30S ribosome-binding factor RbfA [Bacteroidetes bacterium]|nr:MAG: 30S ribosome-binding factor RbfA [Bacteroidota bacterium]
MESIKQKKVAELVQAAVSEYFLFHSSMDYSSALINVTEVKVTGDLSIAKIYVSIMPSEKYDRKNIFTLIEENNKKIRKYVGDKLAKKVRKIPELRFYLDESLDVAERIEQLLKKK